MKTLQSIPSSLVAQSRTIDKETIQLYAQLCDDFNPIHVDEDFASRTPFGRPIAHGTLTLALVWEAFQQTFGRDVLPGAEAEIRFVRPVKVDTRVTARGTRTEAAPGHHWEVDVTTDDGVVVLQGTVTLPATTPLG